MSKQRIATISLAAALATASAGVAAVPAPAAPQSFPGSPGACNMFRVFNSAVGFAGMAHSANGRGLGNMEALLTASGCL